MSEVRKALGVSAARIDELIALGRFSPAAHVGAAKKTRVFLADTIRAYIAGEPLPPIPPEIAELWNTTDVAHYLGADYQDVIRIFIQRGYLHPVARVGPHRMYLFSPETVRSFKERWERHQILPGENKENPLNPPVN